LGGVAPGGTGSGLYGILILAVLTVFIAGLMVGRTPEYLGKKISSREVKLASLYFLTTPTLVLIGTGLAMAFPAERAAMANPNSAHGLSEVLYAFTSATNNNGSAFAGLTVSSTWYNTALGLCMLIGRFLPMVFVLGLAGSLAKQKTVPESAGTLRTHQPLFVGMLVGVTIILVALTFLPALALVPSPKVSTEDTGVSYKRILMTTDALTAQRADGTVRRRVGGGLLDPKQLWRS